MSAGLHNGEGARETVGVTVEQWARRAKDAPLTESEIAVYATETLVARAGPGRRFKPMVARAYAIARDAMTRPLTENRRRVRMRDALAELRAEDPQADLRDVHLKLCQIFELEPVTAQRALGYDTAQTSLGELVDRAQRQIRRRTYRHAARAHTVTNIVAQNFSRARERERSDPGSRRQRASPEGDDGPPGARPSRTRSRPSRTRSRRGGHSDRSRS